MIISVVPTKGMKDPRHDPSDLRDSDFGSVRLRSEFDIIRQIACLLRWSNKCCCSDRCRVAAASL